MSDISAEYNVENQTLIGGNLPTTRTNASHLQNLSETDGALKEICSVKEPQQACSKSLKGENCGGSSNGLSVDGANSSRMNDVETDIKSSPTDPKESLRQPNTTKTDGEKNATEVNEIIVGSINMSSKDFELVAKESEVVRGKETIAATDNSNFKPEATSGNPAADVVRDGAIIIQSVIQIAPPQKSPVELKKSTELKRDLFFPDSIAIDNTPVEVIYQRTPLESSSDELSFPDNIQQSILAKAPYNSLGLLTQYGSDINDTDDSNDESETASVVVVPISVNKNYRTQVVEIDSESDADLDVPVSSDSESEDETDYLRKLAKTIKKRIEEKDDDGENDDDDDDGDIEDGGGEKSRGRRKPPRVRGEMLLDDLPPIQDLQLSVPDDACIVFGHVHSIVDQLVLVSALPNQILIDLGTVLFLEQGKRVLGEVFDVLGQVSDPLYCVRFNKNQHIYDKGIQVGDVVYVAPKTDYTQYIILSSLMKMRGSDASWENDIEPPPRYLDYSDDEEEREARHRMRKQNRSTIKEENTDYNTGVNNVNMSTYANKRSRATEGDAVICGSRERPNPRGRRNSDNVRNQKRNLSYSSPANIQHRKVAHQFDDSDSWHSLYNQHYHNQHPLQVPKTHMHRSPYSCPYPYLRPMQRPPPPQPPSSKRTQHLNPYIHTTPGNGIIPGHKMSSPLIYELSAQQMSHPPPLIHYMPPLTQQLTAEPAMRIMAPPQMSQSSQFYLQQISPPPRHYIPQRQIAQLAASSASNRHDLQSQPSENPMQNREEPAPPGAD